MEQQFLFAPSTRQCQSDNAGADGAFLELSNFEPGRPLDIARRPFHPGPVKCDQETLLLGPCLYARIGFL
jgi:hypothetical protein